MDIPAPESSLHEWVAPESPPTSPPPTRFRHRDLEKGEIRLLEMLPVAADDVPSFRVMHYPRYSAPAYVAVSYCWSSPSDRAREHIHLDDLDFEVGTSLFECLRTIDGSSGPSGRPYTCIWVDAICIDQTNVMERNHQVGTMDMIYAHAESVVAWLMPETTPELSERGASYWLGLRWTPIASNPYWTRRWVLQELSLAKDVEVY
ncbi:hypothetical protein LTR85_005440 [Meristemomyces frigidus]|nr:hypothetical protein LTR85_005440 [Meristemomyces frigidus]